MPDTIDKITEATPEEIDLGESPDKQTRQKGINTVMTVLGKEHMDADSERLEELIKIVRSHAAGIHCVGTAGNGTQHNFSNAWEGIALVMNTGGLLFDSNFANATNHCFYLDALSQNEVNIRRWHQTPDFTMGTRVVLAGLYKKRRAIKENELFKPEAEIEDWQKETIYARALQLVEILIPVVEKIVRLAENDVT